MPVFKNKYVIGLVHVWHKNINFNLINNVYHVVFGLSKIKKVELCFEMAHLYFIFVA